MVVVESPVLGVGDGTGGLRLDVEVVEVEVDQGGVGVGGYLDGGLGARRVDVPDVDVLEVGETLGLGDLGGEDLPVGWVIVGIRGQRGVRVAWVPVHRDVDGDGDAFEGDVVEAEVLSPAAAGVGGLDEDTGAYAGEGGEVVGLDVAEATGGLGPDGDGGGAAADDAIAEDNVVGRAVDAEAVGVAAGLEAEGVVVDVDVGVGDEDVVGGVDVDAVSGRTFAALVVADGDSVDDDVVGVEDLDGPEAGALEGDASAEVGRWRSSGSA